MGIPDYQSLMLPLLQYLSDGKERNIREVIDYLSSKFKLSEEEKDELLPSGKQPIMDNRVGWARTYLLKAGLLFSPQRSYIEISDRGLNVLKQNPKEINIKFLEQFPEFIEFRTIKKESSTKNTNNKEEMEDITPDELMEKGYSSIYANLTQELLVKLRSVDPYYFEKIVVDLIDAMGYGKGKVTQKSGDGGVDGIIYQDKLGLEQIYIQAKRYNEKNSIGISTLRSFVGTLDEAGVNKGIFITTSHFPKEAENFVKRCSKNIILIDGEELSRLMIENNVGVNTTKRYEIKKVDVDFFSDE